jgi:hypothetical protein
MYFLSSPITSSVLGPNIWAEDTTNLKCVDVIQFTVHCFELGMYALKMEDYVETLQGEVTVITLF